MPALVTVIVPVYNGERHLAQSLTSVVDQTYTRWECVVVDDGSTDSTPAIARSFAERDERMRTISQSNAGVSAARNRGLLAASDVDGTLVAFLDGDDVWTPDALEVLIGALVADPDAVGAYGLAEYIDAAGRPIRPGAHSAGQRDRRVLGRFDLTSVEVSEPGTFSNLLVTGTIWPTAVAVHRRAVITAVGGFDSEIVGAEDWDLYLRMSRHGHFRPVDRQVAWYRRHGANTTAGVVMMAEQTARVRWKTWASSDNTSAQRRESARVFRRLAARWSLWCLIAAVRAAVRGRPRVVVHAAAAAGHFARQAARGHPVAPTPRSAELTMRYVARRSEGAGGQLP